MRFIETIQLRTSCTKYDQAEWILRELQKNKEKTDSLVDIGFLRHAEIPGEFTIYLVWEKDRNDLGSSRQGLCLCGLLNDIGLISHSVWIDII